LDSEINKLEKGKRNWLGGYLVPNFKDDIKEIFNFACKHEINKLGTNETIREGDIELLISYYYRGFNNAQNKIVKLLLQLENEFKESKGKLTIARKTHDNEKQKQYNFECSSIENQISIVKKLADSIAWQMIDGQNYIAI
jgi:hypothetical protein